jgi:hypothetical protein
MVNWVAIHFQARLHAAAEPGFLATQHLELVTLHGGHIGYCLQLGINLATPEGQEAAAFQLALMLFCHELCAQGVGHLPYNPAPLNVGPLGPNLAAVPMGPVVPPAPAAPVNPEPPVDNDFVEIIGGVHPIHGPWVVDHDFVEIIGGFDPIHGPWVEAPGVPQPEEQPPNAGLNDFPAIDLDFEFDLNLLQ